MLNGFYYEHVTEIAVRDRHFRIRPEPINCALLPDISRSFFIVAMRAVRRRLGDYFREHKAVE